MSSWKANVWTQAELIPIGGDWAYAVGLLDNGAIRIAKGKLSAAKPESGCPISQVNKLNIKAKDTSQWEEIKDAVDRLLYRDEGNSPEGETE
jgi:hypothetical protein